MFIFFYKERYKIQEILFFRTADIQILQKTYISYFDKLIHTGCWGSRVCTITGINDSVKKKKKIGYYACDKEEKHVCFWKRRRGEIWRS